MKDSDYQATVIAEDFFAYGMKLTVNISAVISGKDTIPLPLKAEYQTYHRKLYLGKNLLIRGRIKLSDNPHRPHMLYGTIEKETINPHTGRIFYSIASFIDKLLKRNLTPVGYEVSTSLLLGGSSRVAEELKNVFTRSGVLHILSVSGLHVGFVVSFFGFLFIFLPIPRKIKFLLIMLILFIYAGVTGFRPTVIRAGLMAFFFGLTFVLQRNVDGMHILNITGMALLIYDPLMLFDIGTQLSFASVYGILHLFPKFEKIFLSKIRARFLKIILTLMLISLSAQLFVSPFLLYYFNQLQTMAVFSNVPIVPLSSVIIYLLFFATFFALIIQPITQIIFKIVSLLINILIAICNFFATPNFSAINLTIPLVFLSLFYLLFVRSLRKFALYTILVLGIIFSIGSLIQCDYLKISSDGIYLSTRFKKSLVVTISENPNLPSLLQNGEVDYLVAPKEINCYKKDFIPFPKLLHYKKIQIAGLTIGIDNDIRVECQNQHFKYRDFQLERGEIINIIIKGGKRYIFKSKLSDSIIDRMVTEFRMLIIKLFL